MATASLLWRRFLVASYLDMSTCPTSALVCDSEVVESHFREQLGSPLEAMTESGQPRARPMPHAIARRRAKACGLLTLGLGLGTGSDWQTGKLRHLQGP